ncbi:MAG TPA: TetR/AcrR family transcriptional regulator [Stellaceae bacterium]|nr:TetR/AcrR family transcriptional regulator [Stellaceae bacterium]
MSEAVRRVRRTPADAKRLILETAQTLVARNGPQGLRLQDIAGEAGISHPLILHHFGSRAGLMRALTREAAAELKDRLVAAMTQPDYSIGAQLDQVFDAFRGGLAQRLAWLAVEDPDGAPANTALILREIADTLHARRVAAATPGGTVAREDTEWLIHLVAIAAFGEAMYGDQLRRSAGIAAGEESAHRFRTWFAGLIREHGGRR